MHISMWNGGDLRHFSKKTSSEEEGEAPDPSPEFEAGQDSGVLWETT